jgi:hypothetical protein
MDRRPQRRGPSSAAKRRPWVETTTAIVDRLTFDAHIIETGTQSYRLRTTKTSGRRQAQLTPPARAGGSQPRGQRLSDRHTPGHISELRRLSHELAVHPRNQISPPAPPQHQFGLAAAFSPESQAQRLRIGNHSPVHHNRLRPRRGRITPGEITNHQPSPNPLRPTKRQLRSHNIKINQPVHATDYQPSPTTAPPPRPKFVTTGGPNHLTTLSFGILGYAAFCEAVAELIQHLSNGTTASWWLSPTWPLIENPGLACGPVMAAWSRYALKVTATSTDFSDG